MTFLFIVERKSYKTLTLTLTLHKCKVYVYFGIYWVVSGQHLECLAENSSYLLINFLKFDLTSTLKYRGVDPFRYTAIIVRKPFNFLIALRWELYSHPPYSPDTAPSDYNLFTALKQLHRGIHF